MLGSRTLLWISLSIDFFASIRFSIYFFLSYAAFTLESSRSLKLSSCNFMLFSDISRDLIYLCLFNTLFIFMNFLIFLLCSSISIVLFSISMLYERMLRCYYSYFTPKLPAVIYLHNILVTESTRSVATYFKTRLLRLLIFAICVCFVPSYQNLI